MRVPLGVVGIIYENRPNVTSDAAGLCLKAGNATMLRGSSGAVDSNTAIVACLREALAKVGPARGRRGPRGGHEPRGGGASSCSSTGIIDCLIPRGGHSLIASVREHATVPYVIDGDGNCHVYVDAGADLDMALSIVVNAKTQRPGVCNAAESLLVHRGGGGRVPAPRRAPRSTASSSWATSEPAPSCPAWRRPTDEDFATEFLDLKLSVAVVDDLDAAIDHIARYGSGHSEAIVTTDLRAAERFCREVDAAAVVVNASTRFVDGGELGLGAEIGISTQKLHARGPMGLRELTCVKYVVRGDGQVRR